MKKKNILPERRISNSSTGDKSPWFLAEKIMNEIVASLLVIAVIALSLIAFIRSLFIDASIKTLKQKYSEIDDKIYSFSSTLNDINLESIKTEQNNLIRQVSLKINEEIEAKIRSISTDCKCSKCGGFTRPKSRVCESCGEIFFKDKPKMARILSFSGGPEEDYNLQIKWECLSCEKTQDIEYDDSEVEGVKFIQPLKCDNCDCYCGEVFIECSNITTVSKVYARGELELT